MTAREIIKILQDDGWVEKIKLVHINILFIQQSQEKPLFRFTAEKI